MECQLQMHEVVQKLVSTPLFSFQDLKLSTKDIIATLEDTSNTTLGPLPIPDPHATEVPSNTLERHSIGSRVADGVRNLVTNSSHEWIEGDEEEIAYAQATKSLKVVPTDIQHGPEVLQRFKVAHKPLVKTLFSFESMESHGEPIKPLFCQLITWTPPEEGIALLEFFGGIGTGLEALLQSRMVVRRYFYVDIDPIAR